MKDTVTKANCSVLLLPPPLHSPLRNHIVSVEASPGPTPYGVELTDMASEAHCDNHDISKPLGAEVGVRVVQNMVDVSVNEACLKG